MLEQKYIKESLAKIICYRCGMNLDHAEFIPVTEAPVAVVAHVVCSKCQAQSMVTITPTGTGTVPLVTDLTGREIKKFISLGSITYDEFLNLHEALKKDVIWKLLQKEDKSLEKRQKSLEMKENFQQ